MAKKKRNSRKRLPAPVLDSEKIIRALVWLAGDYLFVIGADLRLLYVNPHGARLQRRRPKDAVGRPLRDLFPPAVYRRMRRNVRRVLRTGRSFLIEEKFQFPDETVWLDTRLIPFHDERKRTVAVLGIACDVTARMRAQEKLLEVPRQLQRRVRERTGQLVRMNARLRGEIARRRRSAEQLRRSETTARALLNATSERALLLDACGRVLALNRKAARAFHRTVDQMIGVWVWPLVQPPELAAERKAFHAQAVRTGRPVCYVDRREGRWLDTMVYPVFDRGEGAGRKPRVTRLAVFSRDITRQKQAEEAARRTRSQVLLAREEERRRLARELHDSVGQQMTALHVQLQSLLAASESWEAAQLRRQVQEWSRQCGRLIGEVRNISRGLYPHVLESLGLAAAIRQLVRDCGRPSGLTFRADSAARTARFPREVEIALFRIAQEAVQNVLRHSRAGRTVLSLGYDGERLDLTVQDDGVGFDARRRGGSGAGLQTMRERAEAAGGTMEISSRPGRTRLRVGIPTKPR